MKTKAKKKTAKKSKSIKQEDNSLITIILLCDNPGYRMKSYGPISLIDVTSTKKLIDLQIEAINKTFPNCEIIVCLGFDCEKVCKYIKTKHSTNIRIVENQMYAVTNSCESLRLCLNNTGNDKILICDGSLLFDKSIISLIDKKNPCVILESEPNQTLEIGVNVDKDIAYFFSFGAKYIWSEIMFLAGKEMIEFSMNWKIFGYAITFQMQRYCNISLDTKSELEIVPKLNKKEQLKDIHQKKKRLILPLRLK
jgi:hypothetical protein